MGDGDGEGEGEGEGDGLGVTAGSRHKNGRVRTLNLRVFGTPLMLKPTKLVILTA
jgi:hypothetical protein